MGSIVVSEGVQDLASTILIYHCEITYAGELDREERSGSTVVQQDFIVYAPIER